MFVFKFVQTMYDEPAVQVLIDYFIKPANRIAHCLIIVSIGNDILNKFQNIVINTLFNKHLQIFEVLFQEQIEINIYLVLS